jgi:hypothetical protein
MRSSQPFASRCLKRSTAPEFQKLVVYGTVTPEEGLLAPLSSLARQTHLERASGTVRSTKELPSGWTNIKMEKLLARRSSRVRAVKTYMSRLK